jgi:hypothetical protein
MSLLSSLGSAVSNVLAKTVQFGENFVTELKDEEIIIANKAVQFINAVETVLDAAKTTAETVPVVGTAAGELITEAEAILNNLKGIAIAVETGAAQAPGGETNV